MLQQQITHRQGQDRVPQKLQLLVAGAGPRIFMGKGTVAQGLVQQGQVLEAVAQEAGQSSQSSAGVRAATGPDGQVGLSPTSSLLLFLDKDFPICNQRFLEKYRNYDRAKEAPTPEKID